jgi:hypothetical protein
VILAAVVLFLVRSNEEVAAAVLISTAWKDEVP